MSHGFPPPGRGAQPFPHTYAQPHAPAAAHGHAGPHAPFLAPHHVPASSGHYGTPGAAGAAPGMPPPGHPPSAYASVYEHISSALRATGSHSHHPPQPPHEGFGHAQPSAASHMSEYERRFTQQAFTGGPAQPPAAGPGHHPPPPGAFPVSHTHAVAPPSHPSHQPQYPHGVVPAARPRGPPPGHAPGPMPVRSSQPPILPTPPPPSAGPPRHGTAPHAHPSHSGMASGVGAYRGAEGPNDAAAQEHAGGRRMGARRSPDRDGYRGDHLERDYHRRDASPPRGRRPSPSPPMRSYDHADRRHGRTTSERGTHRASSEDRPPPFDGAALCCTTVERSWSDISMRYPGIRVPRQLVQVFANWSCTVAVNAEAWLIASSAHPLLRPIHMDIQPVLAAPLAGTPSAPTQPLVDIAHCRGRRRCVTEFPAAGTSARAPVRYQVRLILCSGMVDGSGLESERRPEDAETPSSEVRTHSIERISFLVQDGPDGPAFPAVVCKEASSEVDEDVLARLAMSSARSVAGFDASDFSLLKFMEVQYHRPAEGGQDWGKPLQEEVDAIVYFWFIPRDASSTQRTIFVTPPATTGPASDADRKCGLHLMSLQEMCARGTREDTEDAFELGLVAEMFRDMLTRDFAHVLATAVQRLHVSENESAPQTAAVAVAGSKRASPEPEPSGNILLEHALTYYRASPMGSLPEKLLRSLFQRAALPMSRDDMDSLFAHVPRSARDAGGIVLRQSDRR